MLLNKIENYSARIAIIGAGYVGLPMAIEMSKKSDVIIYDLCSEKIEMLKRGESYIIDVNSDDVNRAVSGNSLHPTTDENALDVADCFIICVPTPLNINKQPDLTFVEEATELVSRHMKKSSLVILESTTYPGTTEELLKPILEKDGLVCGKDFYLAFSPERVDPGNKEFNPSNTTKIVGGYAETDTRLAQMLYEKNLGCEVFSVSSPAVAEMSKILENTYRNINIGLIDEFAQICHKMNIDIWEVIEAAKTKPFGFQAFYPGPGVGGHCIPLDPFYLAWKVKEYGLTATMIETSGQVISSMPEYVVSRISDILNENKKALNGAKVLVVGVAYKPDISDSRESPSVIVTEKLIAKNADVSYYDPYVKSVNIAGNAFNSVSESEIDGDWDIIVILTAHSCVDYKKLASTGCPIFDTKNILKDYKFDNIVKL